MQDLQEVTHEIHYENYRSEKLGSQKHRRNIRDRDSVIVDSSNTDKDRILKEKEEELKKMQEMVAKMQAQMLQAQLGEQMKTTCN